MKYRVHHIEARPGDLQEKLQKFLNDLDGEVVSILPELSPFLLFYGAKVKGLLIVEKVK